MSLILRTLILTIVISCNIALAEQLDLPLSCASQLKDGTSVENFDSRTATKRLAEASPEAQKFWNEYSQLISQSIVQYITKRRSFYLEAKQLGHSQIAFLESLGIQFAGKFIGAPTLAEIMDRLEGQLNHLVVSNKLKSSEIFFPVFSIPIIQKNDFGESVPIHLRFGEDHPIFKTNWQISYGGNLEKKSVLNRLHLNGLYPLASMAPVSGASYANGISGFLHDLAHFGGFLEYPEYMLATRRAYKDLASIRGMSRDVLYNFLNFESAYIIRKKSTSEFMHFLNIPENLMTADYTDLLHYYSSMSSYEKEVSRERMLYFANKFIAFIGGGARDLITQFEFHQLEQFPMNMALLRLKYTDRELHKLNKGAIFEVLNDGQKLANFAHIILTSRQIEPKDWPQLLDGSQESDFMKYNVFNSLKEARTVGFRHPAYGIYVMAAKIKWGQ